MKRFPVGRHIQVRQRRAQPSRRQPDRNRSLQNAGAHAGPGPEAVRQHERREQERDSPRATRRQRRCHHQHEAHPGIGAEPFVHERQVRPERRRQQPAQQVDAVVIADGHARVPRQLRRKPARSNRGRQSQTNVVVRNHEQLATGETDPQQRQHDHHESRRHPRPRPERFRRAPREHRAQRQRDAPANGRARHPRHGIQHEVGDQAPERQPPPRGPAPAPCRRRSGGVPRARQ